MKIKITILLIIIVVLLVLVFPIKQVYKDGGTTTYTSLIYKIIKWKTIDGSGDTEVFYFPNNFKALDDYRPQNKESSEERYAKILNSLEEAINWQIDATFVTHDEDNCKQDGVKAKNTSDYLISQGYLKKEDMLDFDNESYCKAYVVTYMGNNCNMEYEVYLSCKDYETSGYIE